MDELDELPLGWLRRVPRGVVLVVALLALGFAAFALWQVVKGHDLPPIVIAFFAPLVALGLLFEVLIGVRALRAPTRGRFKLTRATLGFLIFAGALVVFGVTNLVDGDPQTSVVVGLVSITLGVALLASFLRYMAKPVHDTDSA